MTVQELIVLLQTVPAPTNTTVAGVADAEAIADAIAELNQQATPLTLDEDAGELDLSAA